MEHADFISVESRTQFADLGNRKLAYRSIGSGSPMILANRFRGDLDKWDPKFLDLLSQHYRVITFDYSGIGRSTGKQASTHLEMAEDIRDLAVALGINKFALLGWSLGGFIAQIAITEFSELITHGILIGTRPPGKDVSPPTKRFFDRALKPVNDLDDETVLFFNPQYEVSRAAALKSHENILSRTSDKDVEVSKEQWETILKATGYLDDHYGTYEKLKSTKIPLLVLTGEDDVSFPVEDWFEKKGEFPTAYLVMMPQSGHGPHHQFPEFSVKLIRDFLSTSHEL